MIYVIGIGISGKASLAEETLALVKRAGLVVGGKRHLELFRGLKVKMVRIGADLDEIERVIKKSRARVTVVLATGEPNLFGIADFIIKRFGKNAVKIIPNVSIVQEAFARIKENLNDVKVMSVHGRGASDLEGLCSEIGLYDKVAIYTDSKNTPPAVADALLKRGFRGYNAYVLENMGYDDERVTSGSLDSIRGKSFSPLNLMVLIRNKGKGPGKRPFLGIPDKEFSHTSGMITKQELRVIALTKLSLDKNSIVWDIGSGSGSVAVEAAGIASSGTVYAFEKNKKRILNIKKNRAKFNADNIEIINGTAPRCLKDKNIPRPDAVFVGGGGTGLMEILRYVSKRLKRGGNVVVNAVTVESLSISFQFFKDLGWSREILSVNISKTKDAGDLGILKAHNPVFIITARKP